MKFLFVLLLSVTFIGCSSSSKKKEAATDAVKEKLSDSTKEVLADVEETAAPAVASSSSGSSCSVRSTRRMVNFGKVTNVSSISKPFGFYNSGEFPGEATYHDYNLCDMSSNSRDCSINLEFRPRAVESYEANVTISYVDATGESCTLDVPLKGVSTESYLGKDSSKGLPGN